METMIDNNIGIFTKDPRYGTIKFETERGFRGELFLTNTQSEAFINAFRKDGHLTKVKEICGLAESTEVLIMGWAFLTKKEFAERSL